ncbi:MAG: hypothetical protein SFV23_05255 [Planctomycetaceae bacterium]|nr:hypothetical protein [Planctomycetaceae bacterium]
MRAAIDAQAQWRSALVGLRLRIVIEFDPTSPVYRDSNVQAERIHSEEDWIWCDDGRFRNEVWSYIDGRFSSHNLSGGDGRAQFNAEFIKSDPPDAPPLFIRLRPQVVRWAGISHNFLMGLWYRDEHKWLADKLMDGEAIDQGLEMVDGHELRKIRIPRRAPQEPEATTDHLLWLDPRHQYLPRQYAFRIREGEQIDRTLVVDEYREVVPGWWFPSKIHLTMTNMRTASSAPQIELNPQFEPQLFKPDLKPGVEIYDDIHGRNDIIGGASGKELHRKRRAIYSASLPHPQNASPGVPKLNAPAPTTAPDWVSVAWLRWGCYLMAAVFVVTALALRLRRKS